MLVLAISQSARSALDSRSVFDGRSGFDGAYGRYPLEYPRKHPLEYRLEYRDGYSIKGQVFEGLGASAPVGAGADESASLRLIKTGRLRICKRRHDRNGVGHHGRVRMSHF